MPIDRYPEASPEPELQQTWEIDEVGIKWPQVPPDLFELSESEVEIKYPDVRRRYLELYKFIKFAEEMVASGVVPTADKSRWISKTSLVRGVIIPKDDLEVFLRYLPPQARELYVVSQRKEQGSSASLAPELVETIKLSQESEWEQKVRETTTDKIKLSDILAVDSDSFNEREALRIIEELDPKKERRTTARSSAGSGQKEYFLTRGLARELMLRLTEKRRNFNNWRTEVEILDSAKGDPETKSRIFKQLCETHPHWIWTYVSRDPDEATKPQVTYFPKLKEEFITLMAKQKPEPEKQA